MSNYKEPCNTFGNTNASRARQREKAKVKVLHPVLKTEEGPREEAAVGTSAQRTEPVSSEVSERHTTTLVCKEKEAKHFNHCVVQLE